MQDIGFGKRRQSLSEQLLPHPNQTTVKPPENRRRCRWQCVFVILVMTVVFFFYNTDLREMANDLMKHNTTTKWLNSFKSQSLNYVPLPGLSGPRRSTPTPKPTSGFTTGENLQPENTTLKISRKINNTVVTHETHSVVTQQETVKPYVSPGPYYVEYPYEYHYIINEPKKCEEQKPFLVVMVPVAPHNVEHRQIVRSTWGGESNIEGKTVKLFFLLGMHNGDGVGVGVQRQVLQESIDHHDLIQSNFVDCYKNLTIKTMVMMEWLDSFCSGASYAMKVDSDTFVNVPLLVRMLRNAPKQNYMTGLVAHNAQVLRDSSSKWFLPWDVYPKPTYPTYALGLGYVLSLDLPKKLVAASRDVKALYIEDVHLGLCMKKLGISPTDPPRWNYFQTNYLRYNRCTYSQLIVCLPEHTDRYWLWKDYKRPGKYC